MSEEAYLVGSLLLLGSDLVLCRHLDVRLEQVLARYPNVSVYAHTFFSSSSSSFHFAPRSLPTSPKPASGFSVLILSLQSWEKNMYAESARLGAFLSFLPLVARGAFSAFSAALR